MKTAPGQKVPKPEAARRAAILRRYAKLGKPTLADDEAAAAALGVKIGTLPRLVKSWRRHGDEQKLAGAYARVTHADYEAAVTAAFNPDMSNVNPTRRSEISKRIAVIREYLETAGFTGKVKDMGPTAARLGLSTMSFYRLLREWLLHRDPATLPCGSTPMRIPLRRAPRIEPATERHIEAALAELGVQTNSLALCRRVKELCDGDGVPAIDKATSYTRLMAARALTPIDNTIANLAIDYVALELPVMTADGNQMPVLAMVFVQPSGHVLKHQLTLTPPSPTVAAYLLTAVIDNYCNHGSAGGVPLAVRAPPGHDWDELLGALSDAGVHMLPGKSRTLRAGGAIGATFGDAIGRIKLRPGYTTRTSRPWSRKLGNGGAALSMVVAERVIQEIVDQRNEQTVGANARIAADNVAALRAKLAALISAQGVARQPTGH